MTTQTLATLLEHAEALRNTALAQLNQARARRDAARAQAQQLEQYRDEYTQRWHAQFAQQGAAAEIVRSQRQFAERLELALTQQAHALSGAELALTRADEALAAHELRVASVRKLIERRVRDVALVGERRDQRSTDEQALRAVVEGGRAIDANGVFA
jgi:flagellar FliJ protein